MRCLGYRDPRYATDFPVRLAIGSFVQAGRCRDVSVEGMFLETEELLAPNSIGKISFRYEDLSCDLCARVERVVPEGAGLRFLFTLDNQRSTIRQLLSRIVSPKPRAGISLVTTPKQIPIY